MERDRRLGKGYFVGFICYYSFEMFICVIFYWSYFVYCVMWVMGLRGFFLKVSL